MLRKIPAISENCSHKKIDLPPMGRGYIAGISPLHPDQESRRDRQPRVPAGDDQDRRDCPAGGEGSVNGQVCDIQDPEGDVDPDPHDPPDQPL